MPNLDDPRLWITLAALNVAVFVLFAALELRALVARRTRRKARGRPAPAATATRKPKPAPAPAERTPAPAQAPDLLAELIRRVETEEAAAAPPRGRTGARLPWAADSRRAAARGGP